MLQECKKICKCIIEYYYFIDINCMLELRICYKNMNFREYYNNCKNFFFQEFFTFLYKYSLCE